MADSSSASWLQRLKGVSVTSFIQSTPKATRVLALTLVVVWLLCTLIRSTSVERPFPFADIFGIVPGFTFSRLYVWTIFTAGFYHAHFLDMLFNVATLLVVGKYLENIWGSREFVKFVVLVNSLSGLFCALTSIFGFLFISRATYSLWPEVPYGGFGGVISGFAVVGKQMIPEYEMFVFGFIPVRTKHMPLILLASATLCYLLQLPATTYSFIVYGTIFSWIYLRMYQKRASSSPDEVQVGDSSNHFSFASFFPEPIQPAMDKVASVFGVIFRGACCSRDMKQSTQQHHLDHTRSEPETITTQPPTIPSVLAEPQDADRRRLLALKQVDARIAKLKAAKVTATNPNAEQNV